MNGGFPATDFGPLFTPRSVAIVGMSTSRHGPANRFAAELKEFGFAGSMCAIHPTAESIDDIPAYPSFADVPVGIDYAYVAIPAAQIPPLLSNAGGKVKFAQVMTSGFGEVVGEGENLQSVLLAAAAEGGVRILGPNCLGTYSPRGGLTFVAGASRVSGSVGIISQSGGLGVDIIRRGSQRGLAYSGLVTIGNSADVTATELLEFYLDDETTSVVGLYLENVRDGRRLFELLSSRKATKPCVLLKGGRSAQGSRAAASHTGALASNDRLWVALAEQTGVILAQTLEEFIDLLVCLQHLDVNTGQVTRRVAMVGNGGGTSVLGCDAFNRAGVEVPLLDSTTIASLEALNVPPGTSLVNPVDTPAGTVLQRNGEIMRDITSIVATDPNCDAVVAHLNLAVLVTATGNPQLLFDNIVDAFIDTKLMMPRGRHFLAVLRSDGDPTVDQFRKQLSERLMQARIPVLHELSDAARVLHGIKHMESVRELRVAAPALARNSAVDRGGQNASGRDAR